MAVTHSTPTLQKAHNCLTRALRHAEGRDLVRRNVSALVDTPHGREGRPSQALTLEQAAALLEAAEGSRLHAYIVLCLLTGVRSEEARALTWDHVDLDARTISVWRSVRAHGDTKTNRSRRTLRIPQIAVEALQGADPAPGRGTCQGGGVVAGARPGVHHHRGHAASVLTWRAHVWWGGVVDAVDLARRFGLGGAARLSDGPVARGKQGLVWRLDTAEGSWAVKVPFRQSGEDEVRSATAFQEAAYAAGVPTPRVRRTAGGCVFAMLGGRQVRMYEWVDLRAPDAGLDPERVGAVVAAIHRVSATDPSPLDPWYHEPIGAERWDHLVGQLAEAGAPFAGRLAGLRDELVALESWIEPPEMLQTCHRDLWADNVLPTAVGGVCVIDWENSGPADPCQELGCVLFEFARADPGRVRALTRAYREAGGPATVNRRGHFSMLIAQLGHITEAAATDWLTPNPRSPERTGSAAWVGEVLEEPHTRELLETILGAAGEGSAPH